MSERLYVLLAIYERHPLLVIASGLHGLSLWPFPSSFSNCLKLPKSFLVDIAFQNWLLLWMDVSYWDPFLAFTQDGVLHIPPDSLEIGSVNDWFVFLSCRSKLWSRCIINLEAWSDHTLQWAGIMVFMLWYCYSSWRNKSTMRPRLSRDRNR